MKKTLVTAALALAFVAAAPLTAFAGEGMSCCKKADKTAAAKCEGKDAAKCDPKTCPPGKCEKHTAAKSGAAETAKPAAKPAKPA